MKNLFFGFGFLLLVLFAGCSSNDSSVNPPSSNEKGNLSLKFDKTNAPTNVVNVTAKLTREGYTPITGVLNIQSDTSAEMTMSNINSGVWNLEVEASDSSNAVIYSGETTVNVLAGMITQVYLTLQPTGLGTGSINIVVSWGNIQPPTSGWTKIPINFSVDFQHVYFLNNNDGFAVGNNSTILKTTDSGITWVKKNVSGNSIVFTSMAFLNSTTGFVVGHSGKIMKTIDGGETWTSLSLGLSNDLYSIRFNGQTGFITASEGVVIRTLNGGSSWSTKTIVYDNTLLINSCYVNDTWFVVGNYNALFKSTNNGNSWIDISGTSSFTWLQSIHFFTENEGIVVGTAGLIAKTVNGGSTWNFNTITTNHLEEICFVNNNTGYIVGNYGTILKTTNKGNSWVKQTVDVNKWLNSVYFVSENLGFAVGQYSTILKYTN